MGRSVNDQLAAANFSANRYVQDQLAQFSALGYPKSAPFARLMAQGTVRLPPPMDDAALEAVGRFVHGELKEIERRIILSHYAPWTTIPAVARSLGMSPRQWYHRHERILLRLDGWLRAVDSLREQGKASADA